MGRIRKFHTFKIIGFNSPCSLVWCFKCNNQQVKPGKKCQKCGAKCLVAPPKGYKKRLIEIRLIEAAQENGNIL